MDLQLSADSDLVFTGGDLAFARDADAVGQSIRIRLQTWLGETPYSTGAGVPYRQVIFAPNTTALARRYILTQAVLATPGVTSCELASFEVDAQARVLRVSGTATTSGDAVDFAVQIGTP